jgi:hypothetical protein
VNEWVRIRHRLALGVEPGDAVRSTGLLRPVIVEIERDGRRQSLQSAATGRHVLLDPEKVERDFEDEDDRVRLRIYDTGRIYVPRRFDVPMPAVADTSVPNRTRRPTLFPGVCWDLVGCATALRGRVLRGGKAVRWAWIDARIADEDEDEDEVVLRTRADDRGEFLLVIDAHTFPVSTRLEDPFELVLRVFGPNAAPVMPNGNTDPLWDVPVELLAAPGVLPDATAAGAGPKPAGWTSFGDRNVPATPGRTISCSLEFP